MRSLSDLALSMLESQQPDKDVARIPLMGFLISGDLPACVLTGTASLIS